MDVFPDSGFQYQPGLWSQDVYTLPLEASLVYLATEYLPTTKPPLWPFTHESNREIRYPSRHPGSVAAAMGAAIALPVTLGTALAKPSSFGLAHARGYLHTVLLTELSTVSAKRLVGRHRPNYDRTLSVSGKVAEDDSYSFWSGHSAHSFALSTYLSALTFRVANTSIAVAASCAYYGVASWIAAGRVLDNAHHTSDVLVGALVGSGTALWMFQNVNAMQNAAQHVSSKGVPEKFAIGLEKGWSLLPNVLSGIPGLEFRAVF